MHLYPIFVVVSQMNQKQQAVSHVLHVENIYCLPPNKFYWQRGAYASTTMTMRTWIIYIFSYIYMYIIALTNVIRQWVLLFLPKRG